MTVVVRAPRGPLPALADRPNESRGERGNTLLTVLVAMTLFAVLSSNAVNALSGVQSFGKRQIIATNLHDVTQRKLAELRARVYAQGGATGFIVAAQGGSALVNPPITVDLSDVATFTAQFGQAPVQTLTIDGQNFTLTFSAQVQKYKAGSATVIEPLVLGNDRLNQVAFIRLVADLQPVNATVGNIRIPGGHDELVIAFK